MAKSRRTRRVYHVTAPDVQSAFGKPVVLASVGRDPLGVKSMPGVFLIEVVASLPKREPEGSKILSRVPLQRGKLLKPLRELRVNPLVAF